MNTPSSHFISSKEIRERFLKFFEALRHKRVSSSSLIPIDDPTLYFTNAGMVQFKNFFIGASKAPYSRATTSQKCMRVSGKHNDLENVGRTARHHTFFEMLGNFSFGDYFKKEAIRYAWDFLTIEMGIPKEKLWITIFEKDDEAGQLWQKEAGVPANRIVKMGEKDNFWSMGDTGPCGPCSEIHFDHGPDHGCRKLSCALGCDCDRFMEIWNLVFMQFEKSADGSMKPLPKPSIDTGMGLERLACVMQGVHSNYDTDLFTPIIREVERLTGVTYDAKHPDDEKNVSVRVLCDHIRASTFLIADGVQPSNEGRGYVLRRILRRAIRHGKNLGMSTPFFYQLTEVLFRELGDVYPEIIRGKELIQKVIRAEEEKFLETLDKGLQMIQEELKKVHEKKEKVLSGDLVFRLYDTYGFPIDLTELIAIENGLDLDMAGFEDLMEQQKGRGRRAWKGSAATKSKNIYQSLKQENLDSSFVGYEQLIQKKPVAAILQDESRLSKAVAGDEVEIISRETPFYPEGGGQIGDRGQLVSKNLKAEVLDTQKGEDLIIHRVKIIEGQLQPGDEVSFEVDADFREHTMTHHSATHLLHAALRKVLGSHVRQAGSLVTNEKLRFDFAHFEAVDPKQLEEIESLVNKKIRSNLPVSCSVLSYDEAIKRGALAFFGDKYGDRVRMAEMGDFSMELCGGTHVRSTGQIGLLKITTEGSVAAGVRRIEATVGDSALSYLRGLEQDRFRLASLLKASPSDIMDRVEKLMDQVKKLEKDLHKAKSSQGATSEEEVSKQVSGVNILTLQTGLDDLKMIRELSDQKVQKVGSGIVLIGGVVADKVALILRVSKDLTSRFQAGALMKEISAIVGGTGGGRADMAQGGGPLKEKLAEALSKLFTLIS